MLLGCTDTNATKEIENSTSTNIENNIEKGMNYETNSNGYSRSYGFW